MIAFAMDALHLRDRDERTALLKRGAFDMQPVPANISSVARVKARPLISSRGGLHAVGV